MNVKCFHTGLPQSMCGHCSGTHALEKPGFNPPPERKDPHLWKGRDKVEWRGYGESKGSLGPDTARRCAAETGSRNGSWQPKTAWGRAQQLRDLQDTIARIKLKT